MSANIYDTKEVAERLVYKRPFDIYDEERVNKIIDLIPEDVKTVLDVGTGGGYAFCKLKGLGRVECFGMDISIEMIKRLGESGLCAADIKEMPFKDGSFDLVLLADVIEHIEEKDFQKSMAEIKRVARKYILINSPYKDAIDWPVSLCDSCNTEFNIYGHQRKVDGRLLRSIFSAKEFDMVKMGAIGKKRDPRPSWLVHIGRRWGRAYSSEAVVCPNCFNKSVAAAHRTTAQKFISRSVCLVFAILDRAIPAFFKSGSECCALIRKKGIR